MIWQLLFNVFVDLSFIALPVFWFARKEKSFKAVFKKLGFRRMGLWPLIQKTGILLLLMFAVSIWMTLTLNFLGLNDLNLVSQSLERSMNLLPLFFWVVILRVISEEIFFRGFLVTKFGALPSSIIFAAFHYGYGSIAEVIGAFILGYILAKAFQLNKNLYPNIITHALYNAMALSLL
jgi:membrane protease YdiL (CAAX protease family)